MKKKRLIDFLNSIGHNIKYREYVKPCNGETVIYITEIDGKKFKTNEQTDAHRALEKLMEV